MRTVELRSGTKMFFVALLVTLFATPAAQAAHEKILHDFVDLPSGANPQANLIADTAGNLYGTTPNGGEFGYGAVFELSPGKNGNSNETVLHSFASGGDGAEPLSGLLFDNAGNLYGTTAMGGSLGQNSCTENRYVDCGAVFELMPDGHGNWTESVLHRFNGYPNDGQNPFAGLISDAAGNLYGTTSGGGSYDRGTVFELTPGSNGSWTETILYNFTGMADGASPSASLIFDSAGNLYSTTEYGGDMNCNGPSNTTSCGTVFELTPNAGGPWTEVVLHSFTYVDGAYPVSNVIFDATGNLYGTTPDGPGFACNEGGCGTVYRLTPNSDGSWIETMIYNFAGGPDGVEGGLVQGQEPAGGDLLAGGVVQADGRPVVLDAGDGGAAVSQGGDTVTIAGEDVAPVQPERAGGQVASHAEVAQDLRAATVGPGDRAVTGDGPGNAGREQPFQGVSRTARVELVLRPVQAVQQGEGFASIQGGPRRLRCGPGLGREWRRRRGYASPGRSA